MTETLDPPAVDLDELRASIRAEYAAVAAEPDRGFHFHTGYRLAAILGYPLGVDRDAARWRGRLDGRDRQPVLVGRNPARRASG
jgi:hypothetical protein